MFPEAWSIVEEDVRRHLIGRFPFGIYYCHKIGDVRAERA